MVIFHSYVNLLMVTCNGCTNKRCSVYSGHVDNVSYLELIKGWNVADMGQIWARPGQACDGLCIYKLYHLFSTSEAYIETSIEWIHVWSWSPRCAMYRIFTYIWAIFGVNVGKYSIHGAFGIGKFSGNSSIKFQKSRKWLIPSVDTLW